MSCGARASLGCEEGGWWRCQLWELPAGASCCKGTKINGVIKGVDITRAWFFFPVQILSYSFCSTRHKAIAALIVVLGTVIVSENGLIAQVPVYKQKGVSRFIWDRTVRLSPCCTDCRLAVLLNVAFGAIVLPQTEHICK